MPELSLFLFGPPRVVVNGEVVHVSRRKSMALLAHLALTQGRHSRETLAALLWPESDQSRALAYLRRILFELKQVVGDRWLVIDREAVEFLASGELSTTTDSFDRVERKLKVDVCDFGRCLAECRTHGHPDMVVCSACIPPLEAAADLYRDDFLAGFSLQDSVQFDEWQFFRTEGLKQDLVGVLDRLVRWYVRQGTHRDALAYARRWQELDPLSEDAQRSLMMLYAAIGQTSAALRQYRLCERMLQEELGLFPSEQTRSLYERIRTGNSLEGHEAQVVPLIAPPLLSSSNKNGSPIYAATRRRIERPPALPTSFIGRTKDVARVSTLLQRLDVRLLSLTGPGGIGKTRLALRAADEVADAFRDGVVFVSLASVTDPDHVVATIAAELEVFEAQDDRFGASRSARSILARLEYRLRDQELLLVVENFEHLLAAAPALSRLLRGAPGVKILVTSRAPLNVYGELVYTVPPLEVPDESALLSLEVLAQVGAVRLFTERAQAVKASFELTEDNGAAVAGICARLDGLPLAIELAAARVKLFPPRTMLKQLTHRLPFLDRGPQDQPPRHQTLRATIEWSHNLLDEGEKRVFRRLAVFVGGFSLEAAQSVCDPNGELNVLDGIEGLVDESLVQSHVLDGEPRLTMLETVHEFASEQLDLREEGTVAHERHASYFLVLAGKSVSSLYRYDADQTAWVRRLGLERDNMRVALAWTIDHDIALGLRLSVVLGRFWELRGANEEGCSWLSRAVRVAETGGVELNRLRAESFYWTGRLMWEVDLTRVAPMYERSLALWNELGDWNGIGRCFSELGHLEWQRRNLTKARALLEEGIVYLRQVQDDHSLARALCHLAEVSLREGDVSAAQMQAQKSADLGRQIGDRGYVITANAIRANIAVDQGDYQTAERLLAENLEMAREAGDPMQVALFFTRLGLIAAWRGDLEIAKTRFEACAAYREKLGDRPVIGWSSLFRGQIARYEGDRQLAGTLYAEALAIARRRREEWMEGWALHSQGQLTLGQGDIPYAKELFLDSLSIGERRGDVGVVSLCLVGLSLVALRTGHTHRAAKLMGGGMALLELCQNHLLWAAQFDFDHAMAEVQASLTGAELISAFEDGKAMTQEGVVAYARQGTGVD